MFLIYINGVGVNIKSHIRLFADDTHLYPTVSSKHDTNTLQQDLDSLVAWTKLWQMSLNCDKCKILRVYRSRNPIIHQYTMNRTLLDSVSHHPYLGVELSSNLNWSLHIENIIGKANRSLGFIRRNLHSCSESVKSHAYLTLVRHCLKYACSVWGPHTQKHCQDIKGVQRRAARFVKNCYEREPGRVTNLLKDLNWHALELRRKIVRLTTMYKIEKYRNCTPITPSRRTKLWKDAATDKAIGVPNIVQKRLVAGRNLNATFTELRRTGQGVAKTALFEARAARHHTRQHAVPAGRNLPELNLPLLRANYVCSENSEHYN